MIRRLHESAWILLAAALAYAVVLPRFYVGSLSDDARDILAAYSLLHGHYASLQLPGHPPANFPLPGFPLILAPLTLFFFHAPAFLRCVPYILTLVCIPLLNALVSPWLRGKARSFFLILFAFNPTTVASSGRVMADAAFMVAVLAGFVLYRRALQHPQDRGIAWTGALVGFASLIRPEGILLLPAMAIPLLNAKSRRLMGPLILCGALPLLIVVIRNHVMTGALSGYFSIWHGSLPLLAGRYAPVLKNFGVEFAASGVGLVGALDFNLTSVPFAAWIFSAVIGGLMLVGLYAFSAMALMPGEKAVITALILFSVGFFLLHGIWLVVDLHYLWPLLPIALLLGTKGFDSSYRRWIKSIGGLLAFCMFSVYLFQYGMAVRVTQKPTLFQFPRHTLQWITQNTPRDSFFLTPNAPLITLYTQRFATAYLEAHNADEFRYRLLDNGITHVLARPPRFFYVQMAPGRNPADVWAQIPFWLKEDPQHFPLLYEDTTEEARLYAVRSDTDFVAAFKLYLQAREAMEQGRFAAGMDFVKRSLDHARLPAALNAYAAGCLLSGKNLDAARRALEEALAKRPDFGLAALNLARIYKHLQDPQDARYYFAVARTFSQADPAQGFLIPVIDREEKEM